MKIPNKLRKKYFTKENVIVIVASLILLVGVTLVIYFDIQQRNRNTTAAGAASIEPEDGTGTGDVTVVNDSNASAGKYIRLGSTPTPTPTGWPDASNTGYQNAPGYPGSLTTFSGTIQSNQTYQFKDFPDGLDIPANISNVTFYGCHFSSNQIVNATVTTRGDNITFDYSSFTPKDELVSKPPSPQYSVSYDRGYQFAINQYAGKLTVDHSNFWGFGNAIQFEASTQLKPLTVSNSWFHNARDNDNGLGPTHEGEGPDHTDGILENWGGPNYMVFNHNTFVSKGNTNGLALQGPSYDHVTITNNYFSGFGATVAIGTQGPSNNITFTDNVFGTDIQPMFRPLYGWWNNGTNNTWRRNKIHYVTGTLVYWYYGDIQADWRKLVTAADDGKYWLPDPGGDPNAAISSTDYTGN